MGLVKRIFLVRHGQSMGNVDKTIHQTTADHAIPLSEEGKLQAVRAGEFLGAWFQRLEDAPIGTGTLRPRLWTSPYLRTRQTSDGIEQGIDKLPSSIATPRHESVSRILDRREDIALCEQQFGLFDGIPDEDLPLRYPDAHAHYRKQEEFEGRFWARMPMGESRFDVAMRVHQAFGTWQRDAEKHDIDHLIVVSHGVTIRAILMRWLHLPFEWFETERNPKNCSVRLIEDNEDRGYIYTGG